MKIFLQAILLIVCHQWVVGEKTDWTILKDMEEVNSIDRAKLLPVLQQLEIDFEDRLNSKNVHRIGELISAFHKKDESNLYWIRFIFNKTTCAKVLKIARIACTNVLEEIPCDTLIEVDSNSRKNKILRFECSKVN